MLFDSIGTTTCSIKTVGIGLSDKYSSIVHPSDSEVDLGPTSDPTPTPTSPAPPPRLDTESVDSKEHNDAAQDLLHRCESWLSFYVTIALYGSISSL